MINISACSLFLITLLSTVSGCLDIDNAYLKELSLDISKRQFDSGISNNVKDHYYAARNVLFKEKGISPIFKTNKEIILLELFHFETAAIHYTLIEESGSRHNYDYIDNELKVGDRSMFPEVMINRIRNWLLDKPEYADTPMPSFPIRVTKLERSKKKINILVDSVDQYNRVE